MTFEIRDATAQDLPYIVDMNDEIQRQHASWYPESFRYPTDPNEVSDFFEELLNDEHQSVLVATSGDEIVAYLWYEVQCRQPNPFSLSISRLFVHHIFVCPRYRRMGVAQLLFDHVRATAESGCHSEVALDTWASNADAQAFLASQGFDVFRLFRRTKLGSS